MRFITEIQFKDGSMSCKPTNTLNDAMDVYTYCPRPKEIVHIKIFDKWRVNNSNPDGLAYSKAIFR